jgi:hypothetical protein
MSAFLVTSIGQGLKTNPDSFEPACVQAGGGFSIKTYNFAVLHGTC